MNKIKIIVLVFIAIKSLLFAEPKSVNINFTNNALSKIDFKFEYSDLFNFRAINISDSSRKIIHLKKLGIPIRFIYSTCMVEEYSSFIYYNFYTSNNLIDIISSVNGVLIPEKNNSGLMNH